MVSNATLGKMRYQFWRDAIKQVYDVRDALVQRPATTERNAGPAAAATYSAWSAPRSARGRARPRVPPQAHRRRPRACRGQC